MKTQLKTIFIGLFSLMICLSFTANAQHKHPHPHKHPHKKAKVAQKKAVKAKINHNVNMASSAMFLKRTNKAIRAAYRMVKTHHVHTGDLSKAIAHQRYAKKLMSKHRHHRAVLHSRIARMHAFKAIKANKGSVNKDWNFSADETAVIGTDIPADSELEAEMKTDMPNVNLDDSKISDKEMTEVEVLETDPSDYKGIND